MNLFEQAILKKELNKFILGVNEYFVPDREYGGHWPLGSYNLYIKEYLEVNNGIFKNEVWFELTKILNGDDVIDINLFIDNLIGYLTPYYNDNTEIQKNRVLNTPHTFIAKLRDTILSRKKYLLNNKSGTGVEWNSGEGLWESILNNLKIIEQRGGPKFINYNF